MAQHDEFRQAEPFPRILGFLPVDPYIFLLSAPDLISLTEPQRLPVRMGRVLDCQRKRIYSPMPLISLSIRLSWQEYTGDQDWLKDVLPQMEEIE